MKNTTKFNSNILASIIPLSILFVLVQAASLIGFFHVSFRAVEKYVIKENLQSCVDAVQTELDHIGGIVYEWSAWDDTSRFVKGENPNFIQDSMVESTMREQNLNAFCIVDTRGKPIWTRCIKIHDDIQDSLNLTLFSPEVLEKCPALWEHQNPTDSLAGYYSTEGGVLMLVSRPITSSSNTGPVCGAVIMGRFINDTFIASITRRDCTEYQWWNLRTDYTRDAMQHYLSRITDQEPVYIEVNPNAATAYTILPDIDGNDAILIKFAMANNIDHFKKGWLARCAAIYGIEGLIFIAYLAAFANKHCIKCQSQIQQHILATTAAESISIKQPTQTLQPAEELPI